MENSSELQEKWVKEVIKETFAEQKKARRWGIVFKSLTFIYLFIILIFFTASSFTGDSNDQKDAAHTAIVTVNGIIAAEQKANANLIVTGLRSAFENKFSRAVMLVINSPGGSPVQAGYVYDEIKRLRILYPQKKLYAVIGELGASGGYYIAAAADQIYADKASLVGSIGVTASSFGFVELLKKMGIERRHFTAGKHKAFLDPFSPSKEKEREFWQEVLDVTHQQFIKVVEEGRKGRIDKNKELFSGLIWNGEQALTLGLIDGLGSPGFVAREIVKAEHIVDYSVKPTVLEAFMQRFGIAVSSAMVQQLQAQSSDLSLR